MVKKIQSRHLDEIKNVSTRPEYCHDLGVCVTYRRVLDWNDWIYCTYTHVTAINYGAIAIFTPYSSPLHTLVS
jgi:hypothetical protein